MFLTGIKFNFIQLRTKTKQHTGINQIMGQRIFISVIFFLWFQIFVSWIQIFKWTSNLGTKEMISMANIFEIIFVWSFFSFFFVNVFSRTFVSNWLTDWELFFFLFGNSKLEPKFYFIFLFFLNRNVLGFSSTILL